MGLMSGLRNFWTGTSNRNDIWPYVNFGGNSYPIQLNQTLQGHEEKPQPGFAGLVDWAYKSNAVVFACMQVRAHLFSEARFQFRRLRNGRPGDLFGTADLAILDTPWPNGTTGDLLSRMLMDTDGPAGNSFIARQRDRLVRLRPDWVTIILGSQNDPMVEAWDLDAEVLGYAYQPGGPGLGHPIEFLQRQTVAHFAPIPDPLSPYRGMSPMTPIMREVASDSAATTHKLKFFENGATPNMVVSLDAGIAKTAFDEWVQGFQRNHEGVMNAYRTLYLGGGAKVEVVGKDLQQIDFKLTQGAGETRIAAAFGVPPVIVGLSEGLQAATYSNYSQARRRFADGTMRPLWRNACASLATIVNVPGGAELWYDDRDVSFLQDDMKDRADIQSTNAIAIKTLTDAGFDAQTVVDAITAGDLSRLSHSGLFSVQLQPPQPDLTPAPLALPPAPLQIAAPRDLVLLGLAERQTEAAERRAEAAERRAEQTPIVNVAAPEITVNTPDVTVTTPDVTVTVEAPVVNVTPDITIEPTQVTIAEGAIQIQPPAITISEGAITLVDQKPMRSVIDFDEDGNPIGSHEVPETVESETVTDIEYDDDGRVVRITET